MEKIKDQKDRGGKVSQELLEESGLVTFDLLGQTLADVPVGDVIFQEMGSENKGDSEVRIVDLGGDKGAGGGMCYREHLVLSIL